MKRIFLCLSASLDFKTSVSSLGVLIARCWVSMAAVRAVSGGVVMQMFSAGGTPVCECVCAEPESGAFEEAADTNTLMFVYAGH